MSLTKTRVPGKAEMVLEKYHRLIQSRSVAHWDNSTRKGHSKGTNERASKNLRRRCTHRRQGCDSWTGTKRGVIVTKTHSSRMSALGKTNLLNSSRNELLQEEPIVVRMGNEVCFDGK